MNTPDRRQPRRRVPEARARAAAAPIDYAKIGRTSVRRSARGMTHAEAAAALDIAYFERRQNLRHEESADDGGRSEAALLEWQRIVQLLTVSGGPYDPGADAVVQEELAENRRREEAARHIQQEQQQLAVRADELASAAGDGRLDRTVPSLPGDEAARDVLAERRDYRTAAVGVWLARALVDRSGHYSDPDARMAADSSLPAEVRAHAALLAALARTGAPAVDEELDFAGRLAQADPGATAALAAWLTDTLSPGANRNPLPR
ncbi:hypothetical protein [Streptomyces sp. NPDC058595]|uniref:hypothetical protein n=1 Tax=Streptomyces sp. NPDC058595 TaxID=3346550 RepID=UPI003659DA17